MKTPEGSTIEFVVDNINQSLFYNPTIRFEPTKDSYEEVEFKVVRPGPPNPDGPCRDVRPEDDTRYISLPANTRSYTIDPPICLEQGRKYIVKITIKRFRGDRDTPTASVLIDSVSSNLYNFKFSSF